MPINFVKNWDWFLSPDFWQRKKKRKEKKYVNEIKMKFIFGFWIFEMNGKMKSWFYFLFIVMGKNCYVI